MAKVIMVQGTTSNAGKSLTVAALCRIFRQDGLRAAPFKSQNMALNSFITADGAEMGRAQVMQAEAAGIAPDVRMNPILLKPTSDCGSQVIVNGKVRGTMAARDYFAFKKQLIPDILRAYNSLAAEYDVIVIEGAGSPAEINLRENDIVNMGLAEMVDAPVLLVGDIDRGGVFASLYGTAALLEPHERARIKGLIVNKFRGDADILKPGLEMLEQKLGIPFVGVVPYLHLDLDDEDSLSERLHTGRRAALLDIAVIRLPRISNFTDFAPLERMEQAAVRYVTRTAELRSPDMILLPGSKNTMGDLKWLRQSGLEAAIRYIENDAAFYTANDDGSIVYFAQLISRTGSYLSRAAGVAEGTSMAYLIAPPMEAIMGLDAAVKSSGAQIALFYGPPTETNFAGGLLVGEQSQCQDACETFARTVEKIAAQPLEY